MASEAPILNYNLRLKSAILKHIIARFDPHLR